MVEIFRYANAIIAFIALTLWMRSLMLRWDHTTWHEKHVTLWISAILFDLCYGSIEAAQTSATFGFRVVMLSASLIGLVFALTYRRDELK